MTNTSNTKNILSSSPTLVLGATGSYGGAVAAELLARGHTVRALVRDAAKLALRFGRPANLEVIVGDVQNSDDLARAATGCGVIVHGVNYSYDKWFPHMETATTNILNVARREKALIVFPGNIYSLGAAGEVPHTETAPHAPTTKKGKLRQWMEDGLRDYAETGGRVLVMRGGDYFGPTVRNGLVDPAFENATCGKPMMVLGTMTIAHQWAYVPDLARASVDLLARADTLQAYEVIHFDGHTARPQRSFFSEVARQAGSPDKIRRAPWWLLDLIGLFSPLIREVVEMRYIWNTPVLIEGRRFAELLPDFKVTPLETAIAETLESYREEAPVGEAATRVAV
jgi:nucleoside-diphosphate-sugar epimerase